MMQTENQAKYNEKIEAATDAFFETIRLVLGQPVIGHQELATLIAAHREDAARNAITVAMGVTLCAAVPASTLSTLEESIYGAAFVDALLSQPGRIREARDAGVAAVAAHRTIEASDS